MSTSVAPRRFSNEVFGLILAEADRGTVAVCSRVCLAFLELTGPLLYNNITIDREDQAEKLFHDQVRLNWVDGSSSVDGSVL